MYLTRRQRQIYEYIREFIAARGYAPSIVEIGQNFRLTSPATVHKHLQNLAQKGLIKRSWNRSRAIELLPDADTLGGPAGGAAELPLRGLIAAGVPLEAVEDNETIPLPWSSGQSNLYVLKVKGDSMIEDHIQEGDYVIVEGRQEARNGETVVALLGGEAATLKRFYREGGQVRLQPANAQMSPILVNECDLRIQGVVVGVLRKY
ncbi:MAG: transcriptional repressor LexA [Nitrospinota bacterium]|nr:transcriptional repressor LexA [Nitrospinota bacterium]